MERSPPAIPPPRRVRDQHFLKPGYDFGDEFEFGLDLILDGLTRWPRASDRPDDRGAGVVPGGSGSVSSEGHPLGAFAAPALKAYVWRRAVARATRADERVCYPNERHGRVMRAETGTVLPGRTPSASRADPEVPALDRGNPSVPLGDRCGDRLFVYRHLRQLGVAGPRPRRQQALPGPGARGSAAPQHVAHRE